MTNRFYLIILATIALGVVASIVGCSDNDIMAPATEPTAIPGGITNFFPIDPGYTSTYEVRNFDGHTNMITFRVGSSVDFTDSPAYEWFYESGSGYDTSYIVVNGPRLYLYENKSAIPELILQGPLSPGSRWNRYPTTGNSDTVIIVTGGTDMTDILDGNPGNNGANAKVFPTVGSNELRVERVETIELQSGSVYSGCVKVVNLLSGSSSNEYWFAPGFGLVKYVIGATPSYPQGQQCGELVSYIK